MNTDGNNETRRVTSRKTVGSISVEQVVLVTTVAIVFVTALVPIGMVLLNYHTTIEFILALPIP